MRKPNLPIGARIKNMRVKEYDTLYLLVLEWDNGVDTWREIPKDGSPNIVAMRLIWLAQDILDAANQNGAR